MIEIEKPTITKFVDEDGTYCLLYTSARESSTRTKESAEKKEKLELNKKGVK